MEYTDEYSFARSYIGPGEMILWKGKPGKGHLLTSQDAFMIPFSIFWCGFAFFWFFSALRSGGFFAAFGIPFVIVGLYITVGRFIHAAIRRKRTAYVITNKKIIRCQGGKIDMLQGRGMPAVHVTAFRDGNGTIRFGEMNDYRGNRNSFDPSQGLFTLENIPEVVRVQQIIDTMER